MANTTWSATDKVNVNLSGTNSLTATGSGVGGARSIDYQYTGKYYWEITIGTIANVNTCFGIADKSANLASVVTSSTGAAVIYRSGAIYVNNANTSISLGTLAAGNVVCIAVDFGAARIWFRVGAAGNWNNNASYNPATGVGGVSFVPIISLLGRTPLHALIGVGVANDAATANFGDTAFAGAVPSGFTSGFTSGAVVSQYTGVTQVSFEEWISNPFVPGVAQVTQVSFSEWLTTNPPAQLTQLAIEEWTSNATTLGQALMTILAIEEWRQISRAAPPITMQPYGMILA